MDNGKTIDFHAHPVTKGFHRAMAALGIDVRKEDGFPMPDWSADAHLSFMDQACIDHSVLSVSTPHIHNGDDAASRGAARKINEELAAVCEGNPARFSFAAALPLPCVGGSIDEAAYAMDTLGAVGVKVPTNANGVYLGDRTLDPLMEELNRRKTLVIIHPCRAKERPVNVITGTVAAIFEYPADTTRAVLNMISNRIMTRYPNIRWVVPHCGSFLPYMLQRFSGVSGILAAKGMMENVDVSAEFSRLWFDIAGDPEPAQLDMLRSVAEDTRIVYGSDYPYAPAKVILAKNGSLMKTKPTQVSGREYTGKTRTGCYTGQRNEGIGRNDGGYPLLHERLRRPYRSAVHSD